MVKIQELSATLIDKYGLGKEDAEHFITQMFALIADELHSSQTSVKVKGLGTFKVTSVSSRESVDVNSGERIVISGRNKITFTPDVVMRDRVNRPFAQFETVPLNDGVDFSEIDGKDADDMADEERQEADEIGINETGAEEVQKQHSQEDETRIPDESVVPDAEDNVSEFSSETESVDCKAEDADGSDEDDEADNVVPPVVEDTPVPAEDPDEDETPGGFLHIRCMKFCCLSALAAVVLCCVCFGFYYLYDQLQLRNQRIAVLEKDLKQVVEANKKANENLARRDSANIIDVGAALANADRNVKGGSVQAQNVPAVEKEEAISVDYESDPRLRTGAYIIIGVDRTVAVMKGQTLESISKAYLGPGMECYVEVLNSCKKVSAGDSLKIPKLKLKKRIR